MKKERIKSIILVALVISSLLLTCNIWLNENLWPDGVHFFSGLEKRFTSLFSQHAEQNSKNILFPAHIVAYTVKNSDHASCALTSANENYLPARAFCDSTLASALTHPQKYLSTVDEATWKNALFNNGFFLDYGAEIPSDVFCAFSGVSEQAELVSVLPSIRYAIITAEGNLVSNISVYLRDGKDRYVKISTTQPKGDLTDLLNSLKEYVTPDNRFSFFIGADTPTGSMGEVLFNSYLLLTESETTLSQISATNLIYENNERLWNQNDAEALLHCFSMNPKTAKKYTDAEENIIYLQNHATLKISKNGLVEYTAAAGQKGFALFDTPNANAAANARKAVELAYNVYSVFSDTSPQLYISAFSATGTNNNICLDYSLNGTKILTDLNGGHAADIEIQDGYVQRCTLFIRKYEPTQEVTLLPSSYVAVDKIFAAMETETENKKIENMFIGYHDDATGILKPTWFIQLENDAKLKPMRTF